MKKFLEPPIAIILTMPSVFFQDRNMGMQDFSKLFERYLQREDAIWNYRKTQLPTQEVAYVYLVWDGKVQYRCNFVGYERHVAKSFDDAPDGKVRNFPATNWILLTGPAVKPPHPIAMKGFQGHRYLTKELW